MRVEVCATQPDNRTKQENSYGARVSMVANFVQHHTDPAHIQWLLSMLSVAMHRALGCIVQAVLEDATPVNHTLDIFQSLDPPPLAFAGRRGFTLIELIVVVVIIAILFGISLPKYNDHSIAATNAADQAAIGAVNTALRLAYMDHRMTEAPASQWIDDVDDIAAIMSHELLPDGLTINAGKIVDQRGNAYSLTAETTAQASTLTRD